MTGTRAALLGLVAATVGAIVVVLAAAAIVPAAGGLAGAATKAGSVPPALVGCWHRHVPALPTGVPAGVWWIAIKRRGPLAAFTPGSANCGGTADFTAPLSVVGNRLTIGPTSNAVCPSNGVYTWKLSGNSLALRAVADKACGGIRAQLFTGVWKRK